MADSTRQQAESIVQAVCNVFRVDDPPEIGWDCAVDEVTTLLESYLKQNAPDNKV